MTRPTAPDATSRATADRIRRRVFSHVLANDGGYLSQACSSAEILSTLYTEVLRLGPSAAPMIAPPFAGVPGAAGSAFVDGGAYNGPQAPELDRFIFSPAHYALVLYATLIEVGRLDGDTLDAFNADGGTVEMIGAEHSPGFATTTGSLSQAISQAGGIALARKRRGDPGRVWVMMSDGEFSEGQTWEALAAAAWYDLDNLRVVVDANGQQCDGPVDTVMGLEPLVERVAAFGASVAEVDGHDVEALHEAMTRRADRPHVVVARTDPTRGVPLLAERAPLLHYLRFASDEERTRYRDAYRDAYEESPS